MNGLATMAALNEREVSNHYKRKPLKMLLVAEDVKHSPDYSGGDIPAICRYHKVKLHHTYFVDSSGLGGAAMSFPSLTAEVTALLCENPERMYYSALTGIGQFQVYVSIFYRERRK